MHRLLGPLAAVVVAFAAWPARASAAAWTCEASALRAQVLTAPAVEPAVANRGGGECQAASSGGAFPPALPVGLSATALRAETIFEGPLTAPAQQRVARAQGTVADVGVASLSELPIDLPDPDFSDLDAVRVPGVGTLDLRPALEALVQPRALPGSTCCGCARRRRGRRPSASAACPGSPAARPSPPRPSTGSSSGSTAP